MWAMLQVNFGPLLACFQKHNPIMLAFETCFLLQLKIHQSEVGEIWKKYGENDIEFPYAFGVISRKCQWDTL